MVPDFDPFASPDAALRRRVHQRLTALAEA
jgi:hypothetical protein